MRQTKNVFVTQLNIHIERERERDSKEKRKIKRESNETHFVLVSKTNALRMSKHHIKIKTHS